jgi:hypothetical protein
MTTILDILAVLVLIGALTHIGSALRERRLECPTCGFAIRFRGLPVGDARYLEQRMQQHIETHVVEGDLS